MQTNLASILAQANLISPEQEQQVVEFVTAEGINVPTALTRLGILSDQDLADNLANLFGLQKVDVHHYDYEGCCQSVYQRELVLRHRALPLTQDTNSLFLGISDPTNMDAQDEFRFAVGKTVEFLVLENKQLESAIRRVYGSDIGETSHSKQVSDADLGELVDISDAELDDATDLSQDSAPVTRYINQVLLDAG